MGRSWEMASRGSRLGTRFVVVVIARPARGAKPGEVGLLDPLAVETQRAGILCQKASYVHRRGQFSESLALECGQVRHPDLRALGDLAQLDPDRLADLAQQRAGELGRRR